MLLANTEPVRTADDGAAAEVAAQLRRCVLAVLLEPRVLRNVDERLDELLELDV